MAVADRSPGKLVVAMLVLGAALAPSVRARAQSTTAALAESLFQEGRRLLAQKKYAEACPKLAESQRLDPATGTLLNLAVCHEEEGKLATAWVEFNAALSGSRHDHRADREQLARDHIAVLEPRLTHVTVTVPDTARVSGLEVKLDGSTVGEAAWGVQTPVDPGAHTIVASAPGRRSWSSTFDVKVGAAQKTLQIPVLAMSPSLAAPVAVVTPVAAPVAELAVPPPRVEVHAPSTSGLRTAAYVVGGVGVAALGVGAVFGLRAFSKWSERNANCPNKMCNSTAVADYNAANTASLISDIGVGVGLAAVATAAVLWVRSRPTETSAISGSSVSSTTSLALSPTLDRGGGGLALAGAW
jgi:hypothetical protein